jgi:hypothetical protein
LSLALAPAPAAEHASRPIGPIQALPLPTTAQARAPSALTGADLDRSDGRDDLIVGLVSDAGAELIALGRNDGDVSPADGICATSSGDCTLRAAIEQANAAAGTDAVRFDIPGAGPETGMSVSSSSAANPRTTSSPATSSAPRSPGPPPCPTPTAVSRSRTVPVSRASARIKTASPVLSGLGSSSSSLDGGLTYRVRPNLQLDGFAGTGLSGDAPDWFAGLGISFRLPR